MSGDAKSTPRDGAHWQAPPFWENAVAGLGLLLFLGLLGFLLHDVLAGNHSPPDITIQVKEVHTSGEDYLVIFEARNRGGQTAAGVLVRGELERFGVTLETAETMIDYLPGESARSGGLFFRRDPRALDLTITPAGYTHP